MTGSLSTLLDELKSGLAAIYGQRLRAFIYMDRTPEANRIGNLTWMFRRVSSTL